ncbi:tRNA1(Val) (adenine(37)-N6)-methyltransferase [Tateyamaria pelophila]|uniref:tRNA1(Val) (adenine(37)-N6)-methyltransferase n=1 Tax=Tateyamaria pelophila TaxID=328415 RepID=UPI001CC1568D|nr:methyltransferase [Tateyamaria pelophila]
MTSTLDTDLTHDAFLGGKLHLWQPRQGYRAGVDPVLLAASVKARAGQSVLDLGCGVGAAALCLGARVPGLRLLGVERQPLYADLAARNGLDVVQADLTDLPAPVRDQSFDHMLANPPYFDRRAGHSAEDPGREGALGIDTPLAAWVDAAARRLRHKGYLHMIHRVERVPDILAAAQKRLGSPELLPLCPRNGKAAELVIFRARKDGRADFRLHAPVILHIGSVHMADGESYRPEIQAVLRDGAALMS